MTTYSDENAEARAAKLAELAIDYTAVFIPQAVSRNSGEKDPSLNWRVSLKRNGVTVTTDYMQGIGHVPGWSQNFGRSYDDVQKRKALESAAESGQYPARFRSSSAHVVGWSKLPAPDLESVLYSLISDSEAYSQTFEEWCSNFGSDPDSRKAHATYTQCLEIGLLVVRLVGGQRAFEKLAELFQDF